MWSPRYWRRVCSVEPPLLEESVLCGALAARGGRVLCVEPSLLEEGVLCGALATRGGCAVWSPR